MDNPAEALLADINRFLERTGTPPATFGKMAIKDPNFVRNMRAGREPRFSTILRVKEFLAQQQSGAAQ